MFNIRIPLTYHHYHHRRPLLKLSSVALRSRESSKLKNNLLSKSQAQNENYKLKYKLARN